LQPGPRSWPPPAVQVENDEFLLESVFHFKSEYLTCPFEEISTSIICVKTEPANIICQWSFMTVHGLKESAIFRKFVHTFFRNPPLQLLGTVYEKNLICFEQTLALL
jgi:hypothetical protein